MSFVEADLSGLRLDEPFDALVGRLILLNLKEPAATVQALSRLVRSGGVVSFQEFSMTRARSVPPTPLVTKTRGRPAQDLVLYLEPAAGPAQLHDLGLLARGQAVFDTVIGVGLAHPATHRLGRDVEVGRDLVDRQVTATVTASRLNSGGNFLGAKTSSCKGPRPSQEMSTRAAASPRPAAGLAFVPCRS